MGLVMIISAIRRTVLLSTLGLVLGSGLMGQAVAGEQLDQIKKAGTIKVGLEGTYPPFSFQDESGKLTGFEVEFSEALAKELGVKVQLQATPWAGILAALESKRLDVVINQVTISEERKKKYDFSEPYTISGIQALVQKKDADKFKTAADLKGAKVGVGLGTNYEQWLKENVPAAIVKTYDDDPTKYQDLRVGRIDAILVDRLAALELIAKTKDSLAVSGEPFSRQESGIAIRKGEPELVAAINKAIDKLRADGTLAKLSQKYFQADVTK
jgi:cystine transport system substrate-binding protein